MEYTRDLGYCAAKYLIEGGNAALISLQAGRFVPVPFASLHDDVSGKTKVRMVDVDSTRYAIARRYMLRLRREDFEEREMLASCAELTNLSPEEFRAQFEYLVAEEPAPLVLYPQAPEQVKQ
jgi:6-phosphofructokinase 1